VPQRAVQDVLDGHRVCILDIDIQGSKSCRDVKFDVAKYLFVAPPSIEELRTRLSKRGTETAESLEKRLKNAVGEIDGATRMSWDAWIVNESLQESYTRFRTVLMPVIEECHRARAISGSKGAV
jgi:guanylate kinase